MQAGGLGVKAGEFAAGQAGCPNAQRAGTDQHHGDGHDQPTLAGSAGVRIGARAGIWHELTGAVWYRDVHPD